MKLSTSAHLLAEALTGYLASIVANPDLHARWLNTLSYLENCGARMISSCENSTKVGEEMLKHAAEEFRHAYYLKKQIRKVTHEKMNDYSKPALLGGVHTKHYLHLLNGAVCRHLIQNGYADALQFSACAYLLVTYAIEVRASFLYPLYQKVLGSAGSNVSMKGIIAEEESHLAEIEQALDHYENKDGLKEMALTIENRLFDRWINLMTNKYFD